MPGFDATSSTSSNRRPTTEKLHTFELSSSCSFVHRLSAGEMLHFRKQLEMFTTNDVKINRLAAEGSASLLVVSSRRRHLGALLLRLLPRRSPG